MLGNFSFYSLWTCYYINALIYYAFRAQTIIILMCKV